MIMYEKRDIRVLPDDTDAFGRLNWLAYLRYCEEGELGLMETLGFSAMYFYKLMRISFPRRAAVFEYLSPVPPDSLIDIETCVKRVGKTSLTLAHTFYKKRHPEDQRTIAARAEVTIVAFNDQTYEKTNLPPQLLEALKKVNQKT
jgi:YbgC/YbaW family acyl-CoA thioester hydrolase